MKPSLKTRQNRFITRAEWFSYPDFVKTTIAVRNNGIVYKGRASETFHTEIMRREGLQGDIEYGYVVEYD